MNIIQSLRSISLYPINPATVENIVEECELDGEADATTDVRKSVGYRRAKALVFQYLADAPQVTEAGATYNFTDAQRENYRLRASQLFNEIGEEVPEIECGYYGEDF